MKTINTKFFIIVFFFLFLTEFTIGLIDVFLSQSNSDLSILTSRLMFIFSLPISIFSRDLPFYASSGTISAITFFIINLLIQTIIIFSSIWLYKKIRYNSKR